MQRILNERVDMCNHTMSQGSVDRRAVLMEKGTLDDAVTTRPASLAYEE
jgi:hypothetical protein